MSTIEGMMMLFRGIIVATPIVGIMCYGINKVFISEFGQFKMTRVCCKKEISSDIIGEIKKDGI